MIFFLLSFFTFFQSRDFILYIFPFLQEDLGITLSLDFSGQIIKYEAIYLTIFTIGVGYFYSINKFKTYNEESFKVTVHSPTLKLVEKYLKILFYVTSIFSIIKIVTIGPSILQGNYGKYGEVATVSQTTNLLSFLNTFCYISYLCCFPSKRDIKQTLPLFLFLTLGSLAMGTRGNAVCNILLLLMYFITRDLISNNRDLFINRKTKLFIIISSPFVLAGLSLFAFFRSGNEIESNGMLLDSLGFFVQQGGTSSLITLSEQYQNSLPSENVSYSFGPIINLLKDYMGIGPTEHDDALIYAATKGNNLGATLTYITMPAYYFSGGGLGTSYLAELFVDFGYVGIIIYSFILGVLLRYISFDVRKTLLARIISSFILLGTFFLPRDFAFFMTKLLTPAYLVCFCGLLLLYRFCDKGIHSGKSIENRTSLCRSTI